MTLGQETQHWRNGAYKGAERLGAQHPAGPHSWHVVYEGKVQKEIRIVHGLNDHCHDGL